MWIDGVHVGSAMIAEGNGHGIELCINGRDCVFFWDQRPKFILDWPKNSKFLEFDEFWQSPNEI